MSSCCPTITETQVILWFGVQCEVVKLDVQLLQAHLMPRLIFFYGLRNYTITIQTYLNTCNTWSDMHLKVVKLDVQLLI